MLATCNAYRAHRHGSESPYPGSTPGLNPCKHLSWLACGPWRHSYKQTTVNSTTHKQQFTPTRKLHKTPRHKRKINSGPNHYNVTGRIWAIDGSSFLFYFGDCGQPFHTTDQSLKTEAKYSAVLTGTVHAAVESAAVSARVSVVVLSCLWVRSALLG